MSRQLFALSTLLILTSLLERQNAHAAHVQMTLNAPKCEDFCPSFCKDKCTGTEAKASCEEEKCRCDCPATSVSCKEDECQKFCKDKSAGRDFEGSCAKGKVCSCKFGLIKKEDRDKMNVFPYPLTSDVRAEVRISPGVVP